MRSTRIEQKTKTSSIIGGQAGKREDGQTKIYVGKKEKEKAGPTKNLSQKQKKGKEWGRMMNVEGGENGFWIGHKDPGHRNDFTKKNSVKAGNVSGA